MNNYLKLNQYLAEGQYDKASQLFHTIVLNTARNIYESMESESDLDDIDTLGGDAADDLIADVSTDEDDQEMHNMEESSDEPATKSAPYKSNAVPNQAKLTPAPQPVSKQASNVNNLTPFPKTN